MGWSAAAMAAASVAGAVISSNAAGDASDAQVAGAGGIAAMQQAMYRQTRSDLTPYRVGGEQALTQLQNLTGTGAPGGGNDNPLAAYLTKPFEPTMEQLAQTPGYQFALDQGLKATTNRETAMGLGGPLSGALSRATADYATGLASTTYQQQFQNYLGQNSQIFNMLKGQVDLGENAAAQTGVIGQNYSNMIGNTQAAGVNAGAAGTIGQANALAGGVQGVGGALSSYAVLQSPQFQQLLSGRTGMYPTSTPTVNNPIPTGGGAGINWFDPQQVSQFGYTAY